MAFLLHAFISITGIADNKLVSSDVLHNAPAEAVIDLTLPTEKKQLSEFELHMNAITPRLEDLPLAELNEKDIDFLAKDTGEPKERIELLVAAAKAVLDSGASSNYVIPVEAFYGWFRQGLPTSLAELQKQNSDVLHRALETSLRDNIIPAALCEAVDTVTYSLRQVAADSLLKQGDVGGRASLGDMLSTVLSDSEKQHTFANMYVSHQGTTEAFWNALRETPDFDKVEIAQIQTTLELGTLTSNHLPLVRELQRMGKDDLELNELRGFAKLEQTDWVDIINRPQENGQSIGVPHDVQGEDESTRVKTYAENLNQYIEKTFPTAVIAHRLDKDKLEGSPLKEIKDDFKTFFGNNPGFEFGAIPVDLYLSKDRDQRLKGVKQKEKLIPHLKNMQRVFNITPRYKEMSALLVDNLHSATAMVYVGERRFIENYAEPLGGQSKASEVFRKAEHVHAMALNVYMKNSVAFNSPLPYVISGGETRDERRRPVAPDKGEVTEFVNYSFLSDKKSTEVVVPDYSILFGSLDLCDCQECRSLYSPAAYFVDILKFLNGGPTKDNMSSLEALLTRRPDIENIELTCENTNTQLPYVDLANEILEAAIAPRSFEIASDSGIKYLFGWDEVADTEKVPGKEKYKLIKYLTEQFGLDWLDPIFVIIRIRGNIMKIKGPFVWPPSEQNYILIELNESKTRAILTISTDTRTVEFLAKFVNKKLKIYEISSVLTALDAGEISSWLKTALAEKGYPLSENASLRIDTLSDESSNPKWIILDSGWAFTIIFFGDRFEIVAWPQTSWTSDELRANAEHIHYPAYAVLQRAVYPWSLPLNLPLEEMRVYLGHLGVRINELMETLFQGFPSDALSDQNIAQEYLNLTKEEVEIITGVTAGAPVDTTIKAGPWDFWGLKDTDNDIVDPTDGKAEHAQGEWDVVLQRVSIFLQQSGLSYKELLELLGTYFINPPASAGTPGGRILGIVSIDTDAVTCKLSKLEIQVVDKDILDTKGKIKTVWKKIHRFVRLWRKLGWTMRDLDKAITDLNPGDLNDDFLIQLSHIQRLNAKLNVPLVNMLSWWADIDTARYIDHLAQGQPEVKSLYERLFLNKTTIKPEDSAFELNSNRNELMIPSAGTNHVTINSHLPAITAALGISAEDLLLILRITQSIPEESVTSATLKVSGVDRTRYPEPMFVLDVGKIMGAGQFTIKFQESDDDITYSDILDVDLQSWGQPVVIDKDNDDQVIRRRYQGIKKFIRVAVTNVLNPSPSLLMSAQVVLGYDKISDEMNIANLSLLYRISSLAKALKLSIRDWLIVRELTEIDPFASTEDTLHFMEKVGVIQASCFSINELNYLLRHEFTLSSGVAPTELVLAATLDEIRRGLQKIATENICSKDPGDPNGMTTDPAGELTRKKLGLLDWDTTLIEQIVATLNGTVTYEALTDPIYTDLELPNDKSIYEVNLLSLPDGFTFPAELAGVVTSVPMFKFSCDSGIPIKSASEKISTELYDQFIDHHFAIDINAKVTTETPDITWKINGQYLLVKSGGLLSIYDLKDIKLRASRLLIKPERDILLSVAAGLSDLNAATDVLIELQDSLQGQIAYDQITINGETKGRLRFTGPMTNIRKEKLDTVSPNPDYQDAVQKLYNAPRKFIRRYMRTFSVEDFATDLDALPKTIVKFPNTLKSKVYFDAASEPKQLHFIGSMTEQERDILLVLSTDGADTNHTPYQDAVKILFARSNADFAVDLVELPASVKFPDALNDKIFFDNTSTPTQLHFIGAMTEEEQVILLALPTTVDTNYERAIRALFINSNAFVTASSDIFLTINGQDNDITAMLNNPTTPEDRFLRVLKKLIPYIRQTLSERLVAQKMAETLQLEAKTAEEMLMKWVISPIPPTKKSITEFLAPFFADSDLNVNLTAAAFPSQFRTFTLLYKIAGLVIKFKTTPDQLKWLFDYGPGVGWLNLNTLPLDQTSSTSVLFAGWERLVDLFRLRDQLPLGESVLSEFFSMARDETTTEADILKKLSKHTGWSIDNLQLLVGAQCLGFTFPNSYKDERALMRLYSCFKMMKILGASAKQLSDWGKMNQTPVEELDNARSIKNAVKAKYDDKQWLEVAKPLKDPLREKQRKALVAYLIQHPDTVEGQHWHDVNELYEYFLIDVEMSPCMMTTRIKQAISSVQLFIQRSLMNLESDVFLTPKKAQEWTQWRKWYRVWEANRKVFFYPENWIEPELRDDKSPFYKDLENELLQSDVTADTAEDALMHYLEKLDQVARLEIVGMYLQNKQPETDIQHVFGKPPETDILHVFGRTYAMPHIYFYRRLEGVDIINDLTNSAKWSAWEKIDLDIEGDHLIPVAWNRRLYLFWSIFTEKSELSTKKLRESQEDPNKIWEIKLAWSEYKNERWSPKKVSKKPLEYNKYPHLPDDVAQDPPLVIPQEKQDFSFKTRIVQGEPFSIECYGPALVPELQAPAPATSTPSPISKISPLNIILPHEILSVKQLTYIKCQFKIGEKTMSLAEGRKTKLRISHVVNKESKESESITFNARGIAYSSRPYSEVVLLDLVSEDYELESIEKEEISWVPLLPTHASAIMEAVFDVANDIAAGAPVNVGAVFIASGVPTFGRGRIVKLKAIPPTPPIEKPKPVYKNIPESMQGIGEFVLDDRNGNLVVTPLSLLSMDPTQLIPIPATKFEGMAIVDQNTQESMRSNDLLAKTPGTFRLLGMHQRYLSGYIGSPYFYQDDSSTYFVTNISQPGLKNLVYRITAPDT